MNNTGDDFSADPLRMEDRFGNRNHTLRGMLAGGSAFLVGGGPSANDLPVGKLANRGLFSMGINNVAAWIRVNSFVCSDPPSKFSDAIWLDPSVMKFCPVPKLTNRGRGALRTKEDGVFKDLEIRTIDCPNIWGFYRETTWHWDDRFFTSEIAAWGNGGEGEKITGHPKTLCTLLLGLRLLRYLGARTIFLVGVDFRMVDRGYSFDQGRTAGAVSNNNRQYQIVNTGLCEMVKAGIFKKFGLDVYNTCAVSGLRAFDHVPFDRALDFALRNYPKGIDLEGWYEKQDKTKKSKKIENVVSSNLDPDSSTP